MRCLLIFLQSFHTPLFKIQFVVFSQKHRVENRYLELIF